MGRAITGWWNESRGVWYAKVGPISDVTGKPLAIVLTGEDGVPIARDDLAGRDAAIRRLTGERTEIADRSRGPTVSDVCRAYLAWHQAEGSAERTIRDHWKLLGRFAGFVHQGIRYGDRAASSIVPEDLWRVKRSGVGRVRQLYMSVLAAWNWASIPVEDRKPAVMIPANPLRGIKRPPKGPTQGITEWPLVRRILRLARGLARRRARTRRVRTRASRWIQVQRLAAIAYSGARTAEAVMLEWGDIRWTEGVAVIPRSRHKTGRRTGRDRHIPLLPRLLKILHMIERWPHRHPRYVFATRWQTRPSMVEFWRWIRGDLKSCLSSHGIELPKGWKPYWLRHSFGTTALEEVGADLASSALGHSAEVLKSTYDHVSTARVRRVGKAVDDARKRKA